MVFYLSNKYISIIVFSLLIRVSCKNEEKIIEKPKEIKVEYDMYQPADMAGFMNAMYTYNLQIKNQIIAS